MGWIIVAIMILITGAGGKTPSPYPLPAGEGKTVLTENRHNRGEGDFIAPSSRLSERRIFR